MYRSLCTFAIVLNVFLKKKKAKLGSKPLNVLYTGFAAFVAVHHVSK